MKRFMCWSRGLFAPRSVKARTAARASEIFFVGEISDVDELPKNGRERAREVYVKPVGEPVLVFVVAMSVTSFMTHKTYRGSKRVREQMNKFDQLFKGRKTPR